MKKLCPPLILLFFFIAALPAAAHDKNVTLNVKTLIYHDSGCKWAKKCTKNCVKATRVQAQKAGARPCKVCGG